MSGPALSQELPKPATPIEEQVVNRDDIDELVHHQLTVPVSQASNTVLKPNDLKGVDAHQLKIEEVTTPVEKDFKKQGEQTAPDSEVPGSYNNTYLIPEDVVNEYKLRMEGHGVGHSPDFLKAKKNMAGDKNEQLSGDKPQSKPEDKSGKGIFSKISGLTHWFYEDDQEKQEARKN